VHLAPPTPSRTLLPCCSGSALPELQSQSCSTLPLCAHVHPPIVPQWIGLARVAVVAPFISKSASLPSASLRRLSSVPASVAFATPPPTPDLHPYAACQHILSPRLHVVPSLLAGRAIALLPSFQRCLCPCRFHGVTPATHQLCLARYSCGSWLPRPCLCPSRRRHFLPGSARFRRDRCVRPPRWPACPGHLRGLRSRYEPCPL
jgi:hypothetical protein